MSLGDVGSGLGQMTASIAILAGAGPEGGGKYRKEVLNLARALYEGRVTYEDFETGRISPGVLQVIAEEYPQLYEAFVPQDIKTAADSPGMRAAQARGVQRLEEASREGLSPEERMIGREYTEQALGANRTMQEAVLQNLAARGRLGGGTEIQARLAAQQPTSSLLSSLQANMMESSLGRRQSALNQLPYAAGAVRGQDIGLRQYNADVMNRSNEYAAQLINEQRIRNAQEQARVQAANVATQQRLGEENVRRNWATEMQQRDQRNALRQQGWQNRLQGFGALAGALGDYAMQKDYEKAAWNATAQSAAQGGGRAVGGAAGSLLGGLGGGIGATSASQGATTGIAGAGAMGAGTGGVGAAGGLAGNLGASSYQWALDNYYRQRGYY